MPRPPSFAERVSGHAWTLGAFVARTLRPLPRPLTRAFGVEWTDVEHGPARVSGELLEQGGSELLVVVHGLGGNVRSVYMGLALAAAERAGLSCLLLNARGADRSGIDIHHAGLVADLAATLSSPELAHYRRIYVLGYSLGGHLTLSYACGPLDPRVVAVAAVGSPLDLDASSAAFDGARFNLYRGHVMRALHEIYTAAYQRRPGKLRPEEARRIQRIREWDDRVIAPRFGFASAEDYYARVSVGPRLSALAVPALYVGSAADPMIPAASVHSAAPSDRLRVVWRRAEGHLGFSSRLDLGEAAPLGLEPQVLAWLRSR